MLQFRLFIKSLLLLEGSIYQWKRRVSCRFGPGTKALPPRDCFGALQELVCSRFTSLCEGLYEGIFSKAFFTRKAENVGIYLHEGFTNVHYQERLSIQHSFVTVMRYSRLWLSCNSSLIRERTKTSNRAQFCLGIRTVEFSKFSDFPSMGPELEREEYKVLNLKCSGYNLGVTNIFRTPSEAGLVGINDLSWVCCIFGLPCPSLT